MNSNCIRLVLGLDIHDGKFSAFQTIARKMVAVTETEAGALTYVFLLSTDRKHCRLIETYNDVPAITEHFKGPAVQQFVPQLLNLAHLAFVEFHGDPGPEIGAQAAPLKPAVFTTWHGFDRCTVYECIEQLGSPLRLKAVFSKAPPCRPERSDK